MRKIIASVDIGTNSIKIVVGEIRSEKLNILAASDTPSKGIKKCVIVNESEVIESIKIGLKKIEELIGQRVSKAIINIPVEDVEFTWGTGVSTITNAEKLVRGSDIVRAMQASVYNKIPSDRELINLIPIDFFINENKVVTNPKNLKADKIGVRSVIVSAPKKTVYKLLKVFEAAGVDVFDITLGSIGDYATYKNDLTEKSVGAIVNIGDDSTEVSIFNKGVITNTEVIELGGKNIDNDVSFIYKLNKTDARFLKEKLALAHKRLAQAGVNETLTNKLGQSIKINQYEVTEIVMSRLTEILNLIKKQINLLTKKEISYIIFTGGVTETLDFELLLEEIYGKNVTLGSISILGVRHNKYSSAVGMIKHFNSKLELRNKEFSIFNFEELEELGRVNKKLNIANDSILGKIFGYFFDN